jgi:hypothetical protein
MEHSLLLMRTSIHRAQLNDLSCLDNHPRYLPQEVAPNSQLQLPRLAHIPLAADPNHSAWNTQAQAAGLTKLHIRSVIIGNEIKFPRCRDWQWSWMSRSRWASELQTLINSFFRPSIPQSQTGILLINAPVADTNLIRQIGNERYQRGWTH